MSVPFLFLSTVRPNRVAASPMRSAAVSLGRYSDFAKNTGQPLHTHTTVPVSRKFMASRNSSPTAPLSSPSVQSLDNNRLALSTFRNSTALHSYSSNHATSTDQNAPLFATSTPYPDDKRVFFFDIDNCLYPKSSGIPRLMKARIEQYFRDSGIPHAEVETLAHRYYVDYGLAIRGLVQKHPDNKVDGGLPLDTILKPDPELRAMIESMRIGKKWLFTNAGENHARRVVRILGLEGLFHGMTYCNYLEPQFVCKPDQKAFGKAMREAGVQDPALCFFADDSAPNVDMAVKIGWTAVHVVEKPKVPLTSGQYQIEALVDLPTVLPQLWHEREVNSIAAAGTGKE